MLISIIIPFQNSQKYFKKCLKSAVNQSLSNKFYEVLAINDQSNDQSPNIVKKIFYKKKNCKLYNIKKKSIGAGFARNFGLKKSKGKYIYFLDSDDFLKRQTLSKLKSVIDKNNNVDLVCNNYRIINKRKNMNIKKKSRFDLDLLKKNKERIIRNFFDLSIIPQVISNLIKKELIIKNKIYFKQGYFEDVYFIFRVLLCCNKKVIVKEHLYYKHNRESSIVNTLSSQHISDALKGYTNSYNFLVKKKKNFSFYYYMRSLVGETSVLINRISRFNITKIDKKKYYRKLYNLIRKYIPWLLKKYKFVSKKDIVFKNFIQNTEKYF